jgi:phosphohistidine swiveling domain-containing protein
MRFKKVLEKLEELLRGWGISYKDWILGKEYAWQLQGYKIKPRRGHLDVLVRKRKLPWKVRIKEFSAFPPKNSKALKQLKNFIKETGFAPHFLPYPLFGNPPFETFLKGSQIYVLPNKRKIQVLEISKNLKNFADVILRAGKYWDVSQIKRWMRYFERIKKFAEKKNDKKVVKLCKSVIERCKRIKVKKIVKKIQLKVSQIEGRVAFKGKTKGKAQIIRDANQLSKFKKGNILVTGMTTPDFIVAIEKAKAIVTDRGGIGCHAAVISREFKIPCIIGTKIATKVLKDEDLIEVNAMKVKGVVKILEKAK